MKKELLDKANKLYVEIAQIESFLKDYDKSFNIDNYDISFGLDSQKLWLPECIKDEVRKFILEYSEEQLKTKQKQFAEL